MDRTEYLTKEEKFLLYVFSGLPHDILFPDSFFPSFDSKLLINILKKNKLLRSFAYELVEKKRFKELVNEDLFKQCEKIMLLWNFENTIYRETLKKIVTELNLAGIDCCLLKGLSLGHKNIPRDIGDIDILVDENRLFNVNSIMHSMGYHYIGDERKPFLKKEDVGGDFSFLMKWSNQFEYLDDKSGLLVEIHINFFERKRVYSFDMEPFWCSVNAVFNRAELSKDLGCKILSVEDRFWLIAMHNAFRRSICRRSFCFRYLVDMAHLLTSCDFKWKNLSYQAQQTQSTGFLVFSLEILSDFFPEIVDSKILIELNNSLSLPKKMFKYIQHHCFYSLVRQRKSYIFLYNIFLPLVYKGSLWDKIKSILLFPRILKPLNSLTRMYKMDPQSPFAPLLYLLEPLRFFYRLFSHFKILYVEKKNG